MSNKLMNEKINYGYLLIIIFIMVLFTKSNDLIAQDQGVSIIDKKYHQNKTTISASNEFFPVPFNEIPLVVINYTHGQYKFGADFSLDFGDETKIEQDFNATFVHNMTLDKDDTNLYLELQCDSNDICDTSLAPESVSIYLVDDTIQDIDIPETSIPTLPLVSNNCGIKSIEDCANIDFSIPTNIISSNYKFVVEMSFDEAKWIFINDIVI
jgi:hypothetical protein